MFKFTLKKNTNLQKTFRCIQSRADSNKCNIYLNIFGWCTHSNVVTSLESIRKARASKRPLSTTLMATLSVCVCVQVLRKLEMRACVCVEQKID